MFTKKHLIEHYEEKVKDKPSVGLDKVSPRKFEQNLDENIEIIIRKSMNGSYHQPLSELFGLVAVTNAEKVILERIQEKQGQINMFEESEDDKDRQANELRKPNHLYVKIPSDEIGLQTVDNKAVEKMAVIESEKHPSSGRKNGCAGVRNVAPSKVTEKNKRNKYHEVNYCYGEGESL